MTSNNKPKHLPINHREPTKEELSAQMDREEQQSALGRIRAEMDLQDQKKECTTHARRAASSSSTDA